MTNGGGGIVTVTICHLHLYCLYCLCLCQCPQVCMCFSHHCYLHFLHLVCGVHVCCTHLHSRVLIYVLCNCSVLMRSWLCLLSSPNSRNSFARCRLSWCRADSVNLLDTMNDPGPLSQHPVPTIYGLNDDPFVPLSLSQLIP
jgi:hypothetical protein